MPNLLLLLPLHAEEGAGITPYVIGLGFLRLLLVACMIALLAFGKGREHS